MQKENRQGGVYAPRYYKHFRCVADKCRHSCCIGWQICIDKETYEKYKKTDEVKDSITLEDGEPSFVLREDGRCPHLTDTGLCRLILMYGEAYLSEICRNHPRFYNDINEERSELGLGIVCEEACRLVLESEDRFSLIQIDSFNISTEDRIGKTRFDPLPLRDEMIAAVETSCGYKEAVTALAKAFSLPAEPAPEEWLERLLSLEILEPAWEKTLLILKKRLPSLSAEANPSYEAYYKRLLIYFIYRHIGTSESLRELCARLSFAVFSVRVIQAVFESGEKQELSMLIDISRRYSAEIEYSEDNTDELIFWLESRLRDA